MHKPFLKWVGGKTDLLPELRKRYPSCKRYVEPFLGGGAVFFDVAERLQPKEIILGDANEPLIRVYRAVQSSCEDLLSALSDLERTYTALPQEEQKAFFYAQRRIYNLKKDPVRLIFLNKTCFRGLYRVNQKGEFNAPFGYYARPKICDEDAIRYASRLLQGVEILCEDYRTFAKFAEKETFFYLDPPYRPLSKTSSFTEYTEGKWGDDAQRELARFFREIDARGANVLLSNADPKQKDPNDTFFDELYRGYRIERILVKRRILQEKMTELLISNDC